MLTKLQIEEYLNNNKINSYEILNKEGLNLIRSEIEEKLKGKKENEEIEVEIENAYGVREKELIRLVPLREFKKNKINPVPGLIIKFGNLEGLIKSISGGRVVVDFNHPLAGKTIKFKVRITKIYSDEFEFLEDLIKKVDKNNEVKYEIDKNNKIIKVYNNKSKSFFEEIIKLYKLDLKVEKIEKNDEKGNDNKQ